ncbi:NAD(P)-binding protein, partial [Cadophora sp. DSE1049]
TMTIGVALLGAGIFALEHHLPAIKACPNFTLKAIYSRSQTSAEAALAKCHLDTTEAYFDTPSPTVAEQRNLTALLQRPDIQAVILSLPILVQPEVIRKAMAAGKHVLSEKPIAKDLETAQQLTTFHKQYPVKWAVGENFRFWPAVVKAFEILKGSSGELVTFSVKFSTLVDDTDKYFQTEWRAKPGYQGGFLLDGGIHFIAILRYLLSALGQEITTVSAFTDLLQKRLKPVDTVHAVAQTSQGRSGSLDVSFGMAFNDCFEIVVVTDAYSVTVRPTEVITKSQNDKGEKTDSVQKVEMSFGVVDEMAAFSDAILGGEMDVRMSPEEALGDLRMLEAMLRSGENKGVIKSLQN